MRYYLCAILLCGFVAPDQAFGQISQPPFDIGNSLKQLKLNMGQHINPIDVRIDIRFLFIRSHPQSNQDFPRPPKPKMKSLSSSFVILLTMAAVTAALPSAPLGARYNHPSPLYCKYTAFNDEFDDRTVLPVSVSGTSSVGTYGALNYKVFNYDNTALTPLLPAPSKPNVIFVGLVGELTSGQPQFLLPNSTVKYFDLQNIDYACAVNSGEKAVSCTILISAVKDTGKTYTQNLVYDPPLLAQGLANNYSRATFPQDNFSKLVSVTISIISSAITSGPTNVLFDNVVYQACIGL